MYDSMITASMRLSRKNEPRKISVMQKTAGIIVMLVPHRLYRIVVQESRVMIWKTANTACNKLSKVP